MKCLRCGYIWDRTGWKDYVSFLTICPRCGSKFILRY